MYFGVASNDDARQPDAKDKLKEAFAAAGVPAEIEVYPGALHGWCVPDMAPQNGAPVYSQPDAERAWGKLAALYKRRSPKRPSRNTHNWEVRHSCRRRFPVAARHWRQDRRRYSSRISIRCPEWDRSCPRKIAKLLKRLETSVQKWPIVPLSGRSPYRSNAGRLARPYRFHCDTEAGRKLRAER